MSYPQAKRTRGWSAVGSEADNSHMEPVPLSVAIDEVMAALIERHFEKDEES